MHRAERGAVIEVFSLRQGIARERLASGAAIGQRIGVGPTRHLRNPRSLEAFQAGEVLVASMTDPDWEPIMKRAAAIVTNRGGRFSIGSNDLTQLVLGVDRDSELVAPEFDERNRAVLSAIGAIIDGARRAGRKVGICGQAPSDYPDMVRFLVGRGITSISLNPDAVVRGLKAVAAAEADLGVQPGVPLVKGGRA